MDIYERVHGNLNKLRLSVTEGAIDSYLETSHDRSVMEILDHLLDQEVKNLNSRHVEIRMRYSGIPFRKTMEMFDFSFQPSIDISLMDDLMTLKFIHNMENIVFLGPPGVGKTHLSTAIAIQAMQSGIPAYYIPAVKLVQILKKDFDTSRINYRMATYSKFPIMIVDEIGYLPLTREESSLQGHKRGLSIKRNSADRVSSPSGPSIRSS